MTHNNNNNIIIIAVSIFIIEYKTEKMPGSCFVSKRYDYAHARFIFLGMSQKS